MLTDQPVAPHGLRVRRLGIETGGEAIVFMHADCPVARSEGFATRTRVEVHAGGRRALATLFFTTNGLLDPDEVGLPNALWRQLHAGDGDVIEVRHPQPLASMSDVRAKLYGHRLEQDRLARIVADIATGRYSDVELAAFVTAFAGQPLDVRETAALTRAMLEAGDRLDWPDELVLDKHCVGGLPANRTTPLIVAIVTAAGFTMPKTSSRAITSPAGTADAMEVMAPVNLDLAAMRRVVEREGGCVVWGGNVRLSPADDILIGVERALDVDSEVQLVASILSKKLAAGATHVLLDLPVGATAKVRSPAEAARLSAHLVAVAAEFHLSVTPVLTDGTQPVGSGIGPALEAHDVLAVLRRAPDAPADLRERSIDLSGRILDLAGGPPGRGRAQASAILDDGRALDKFMAICEAQGGFSEPSTAPLRYTISAPRSARVAAFDNRTLARVAKLAGAPRSKSAGISLHVKLGATVARGEPIFTVHAESRGELDYALAFAAANPDAIRLASL